MSIESSIITATAAVAVHGGRSNVFPVGEVPEGTEAPYVTYRRTLYSPVMTLGGPEGTINSVFLFECWGAKTVSVSAKQSAVTLAAALASAIEAASGIVNRYREVVTNSDDYDIEVLELMELVQYSFWHT